jgi:hypothetical protein
MKKISFFLFLFLAEASFACTVQLEGYLRKEKKGHFFYINFGTNNERSYELKNFKSNLTSINLKARLRLETSCIYDDECFAEDFRTLNIASQILGAKPYRVDELNQIFKRCRK